MAEIKISCPHCGQHIQCDDGYLGVQIPCPSCGQQFVVQQASSAASAPPQISIRRPTPPATPASPATRPVTGYAHQLKSFPVVAVVLLHFLTFGLFSFFWLNALHGRMPRVRTDDPSGGKAVGFCFIPFFNLYWIFFSFRRLCLRIDEQRQLYGLPASNLRGTATTTCVLMVIPYFNVLFGFGIAMPIFAGQLQHSVNRLVAQTSATGPQPTPGAKSPASGKSGLVVALVILICFFAVPFLAAIFVPALAAAKNKAAEINCANNEKQLALAIKNYADEHNNRFPNAATWSDAVKPSISNEKVFQCPAAEDKSIACNYAFNRRLNGREMNQVDPHTVMLFESDAGWNANGGMELLANPPHHRMSRGADIVVAFVDGSVQIIPISRLDQLRWNP